MLLLLLLIDLMIECRIRPDPCDHEKEGEKNGSSQLCMYFRDRFHYIMGELPYISEGGEKKCTFNFFNKGEKCIGNLGRDER